MKKVKFFLLAGVIALSQACSNGTPKDSVEAAKDSNESKDSSSMTKKDDTGSAATPSMSSTPVDKDAADFAVEAANGGMMEVQLGNYAAQNAVSKRVKDFGTMMVSDHSKANDELKTLAASKNITLPADVSQDAKKHMDDMMKKKGQDFDKAYMSMMLDDHKKDVKAFEKASKECKDADIKNFAGKTLPVLQTHLDSALAISGKK